MNTVRTSICNTVIILCTAAFISGCIHYAPLQDFQSEPDPSQGYIYGHIQMENYFELAVVLAVKNIDTGEQCNIKFESYSTRSRPKDVTLIALEPGTYQIQKMFACSARRSVFTIASIDCTPERDFSCGGCTAFTKQFTVEKGKAYYIGDFTGISYGVQGGDAIQWEITRAQDSFTETTEKLRSLYPRFSSVTALPAFTRK